MQAVLYAKRDNLNGYTSNLVLHFYETGGQKKEEGPEFSFAGDVTFKKTFIWHFTATFFYLFIFFII